MAITYGGKTASEIEAKIKEQLINELNELRREIFELKAVEKQYKRVEEKLQFELFQLVSIFDGLGGHIYVADPVTYEILFANKPLKDLYGKELTGGLCYRELQGLEAPCDFCTNKKILKNKGKPYKWEFYNRLNQKCFLVIDKIIEWPDGREVRFEFALDISRRKNLEDAIKRRLEFMEIVKLISSRFVGVSDLDESICDSLADMGQLTKAGRAYLFYFRQGGAGMDNTHEWCAEGVKPQIDLLQNLPVETFPWWMEKLHKGEVINITDVSRMPDEAKAEKEILERQDIKSLLVLPLYVKGELSGFIGLDNVIGTGSWSEDDLALMRLSSDTIGNAMERKLAEKAIRESEDKYRTIFENTGTATVIIEEDTTISLVNTEFENISGYFKQEIEGKKRLTEFLNDFLKEITGRFGINITPKNYESTLVDRKGNVRDVIVTIAGLPGKKKRAVSILDITERKRMEKQLQYLSFHDALTGIYNRAYFEEEMQRFEGERILPIGIIVCDVDGLKLVNDTLGHGAGDELLMAAAGIIRKCFRKSDVVARIGGDEFAVILPDSDRGVVERACNKIRGNLARHNKANPNYNLSLSIGFAVKDGAEGSMAELFKEADNSMYREKLHHNKSARNAIVNTLTKTLHARDLLTEGHAERLQGLVQNLGKAIGLPEHTIGDLRLLAQFHDIGKIGVPDCILFKPGIFNPEERAEMQRHCAIGHKIALSAPDLLYIADWILKHHEWWNGEGYPQGLKGEEIPLECRILAIADAYDAMTSDRPYRKAMTHEEAVAEIKRHSGTQFDPQLVHMFLDVLEKWQEMRT